MLIKIKIYKRKVNLVLSLQYLKSLIILLYTI